MGLTLISLHINPLQPKPGVDTTKQLAWSKLDFRLVKMALINDANPKTEFDENNDKPLDGFLIMGRVDTIHETNVRQHQ